MMNVLCSDEKPLKLGHSILMQIQQMEWSLTTVRNRCGVFADNNLVKCVQFACVRHHGKDTSLEDNFPKGPGLICAAVGKLQTPPQMKRKE